MIDLKHANILKWGILSFLEYFIYMNVILLYFESSIIILVSIVPAALLSVFNDYLMYKISRDKFQFMSKKIFFIHKLAYKRNLLERVLLVILIISIKIYTQEYILISYILTMLMLVLLFNYKHVYKLRVKSNDIEKLESLIESNNIKAYISSDENLFFITKRDLKIINKLF